MNYEEFKKAVTEDFMDYMPEEYRGMKLDIRPVKKVNETKDGLSLVPEGEVKVVPTIYINSMFEHYQAVNDYREVLQAAADHMVKAMSETPIVPTIDFTNAKDNITFQFVNTEQNKEMLQDTPHRTYHDLSIIYRWIMYLTDEGIQTMIIHDNIAEQLGLSEEQMYELAMVNTRRMLPPTIKSMNDIVREKFAEIMPEEIIAMMVPDMPDDQMMWIISNDKGINGAINILYEDKLKELADRIGDDLYIMPSSVHEVIAVAAGLEEPDRLSQMVAEVNGEELETSEVLSNQIYFYNRTTRTISLAITASVIAE